MAEIDPLKQVMDITANALRELSENFSQRLSSLQSSTSNNLEVVQGVITKHIVFATDQLVKQQKQICELQEKCVSQEAVIMNLIASIALSNPVVFATIRENSELGLKQLSEQNLSDCELARMLRNASGITPEKKPHLWLVPKKPGPDSAAE